MSLETACLGNFVDLDWAGPLLLTPGEIRRVPDGLAGIYVLQAFNVRTGTYPALYVGKAFNLRSRLLQHAKSTSTSPDILAVRDSITTYYSAAPVARPELRAAIESALVQLLRPPCNRQVPLTKPVYPNLPGWISIPR